jgi:hypothetical protein
MQYQDTDLEVASAGPYTSVPLLGWTQVFSKRLSSASFVPILTLLLFCADIVLAIFAGLDMVDRGVMRPWLQFAFSLAIASLYTALAVTSIVMYFWERVLRFRYHWFMALTVASLLAWSNFGVWASWQTRFSSFVSGVSSTDGNAFTTWIAVNALGVAGFFARFVILSIGIALRHLYDRAVELNGIVLAQTTGGKSLISVVSERSFPRAAAPATATANPSAFYHHRRSAAASADSGGQPTTDAVQMRYRQQFAGTQWNRRQR